MVQSRNLTANQNLLMRLLALMISMNRLLSFVSGHGRLLEPPSRSSIWRFPEFAHLDPPRNYDDNQLFCGGWEVQYEQNEGKCGVCGDPYNEPVPRANEDGGELYRGIIVRGYHSGQELPVEVQLTTSHLGYFEFRLCAKDDPQSHREQECFDEHLLELSDGSGSKHFVPPVQDFESDSYNGTYYAKYSLKLPKGVHCKHCVLQWHYRTGNRWGTCPDGTEAMGCNNQEIFRGCSDIVIYGTNEKDADLSPNSKFGPRPPASINEGGQEAEKITIKGSSKIIKTNHFSFHPRRLR